MANGRSTHTPPTSAPSAERWVSAAGRRDRGDPPRWILVGVDDDGTRGRRRGPPVRVPGRDLADPVRPPGRRRRRRRELDGGVRPGGRGRATGTSRPTCTPPRTASRSSSTTTRWTACSAGRAGSRTCTWADLRVVRDGGEAVVPRLADLLDAWPECRFNIDMKADSAVDPTIEAIWQLNAARPGAARLVQRPAHPAGPASCAARGRPPRWGSARPPRCGWARCTAAAWPGSCRASRRCRCRSGTAGYGWSTPGSSGTRTGSACRFTSGRSTILPKCTSYLISVLMAS